MPRIRWYGPTILLLATVLFVMIAGPRIVRDLVHAHESAHVTLAADSLEQNALLGELNHAFRQVAEVVQPSVVSIRVYARRGPAMSYHRDLRDILPPEYRDMFPERPDEDEEEDRSQEYEQYDRPREVGMGSGWVYDDQGHIITNNHVVTLGDGETLVDKVEVTFHDGDVREAKVMGTDRDTDVAVLKVEGDNLHAARRAVEPVEQGDMVFAFGAPLGFTFSMSQGIVSAKNRQLNILGRRNDSGLVLPGYESFIQTDAAINRGNSGGPLTNIQGQVVGMNSAIATRDQMGQGFLGLGFAIPVQMVEEVAEKLIHEGRVTRGWLGIGYDVVDAKQAATFGYDRGSALLISKVFKNSPAEIAGLKKGDIIVKVNDEEMKDSERFRNLVARLQPDTVVDIVVFRNGDEQTIPVTIANRSGDTTIADSGSSVSPPSPEAQARILRMLGIERAADLTPELAGRLGFGPEVTGVLVRAVRPASIVADEGLRPDMVITHVMGEPVESIADLVAALSKHQAGEVVRLNVITRIGEERFIFPELPGD